MNAQEIKALIANVTMKREGYTFTATTDKYDTMRIELRDETGSLVWRKMSCESDFEYELTRILESYTVTTQAVEDTATPNTEEPIMTTETTAVKLGADFAKDALKSLNTRILKIAKAENIVHTELGAFSREVLSYVLRTKDITPINRIIGADKEGKSYLTRNNKVVAMHFFAEFVPFSTEGKASEGTLTFGKLKGERSQEKTAKLINDFLHNPECTIWTWAKDNIKTEKKPVDYAAKVGNAITNALDETKGNMSKADVLMAVLSSGISLDDMLAVADLLTQGEEKAA